MSSVLMCLSLVVFHEARNQSEKGQMAVLEVVQNRVKSDKYPSNACKVVKQPSQFSWVNGSNRSLNKAPSIIKNDKKEKAAWVKSQKIAKKFLASPTNYTKGATYFNSRGMGVRYKTKTKVTHIGSHVFY